MHKRQIMRKEKALLTFLKRTKEGKYTKIKQDTLSSSRSEMQTVRVISRQCLPSERHGGGVGIGSLEATGT